MSQDGRCKIYFLGSGPIAIPILESLRVASGVELVGIGTQEKPSKTVNGHVRGSYTAVMLHCGKHGIEIERYATVNTEQFREHLRQLGVEMLVVASFGQILKKELLELPRLGCLNIHASLLPKYRGASPVVASLLHGDKETGISFMQMEAGLDTGPVYRSYSLPILPTDVSDTLEQRLGALAGEKAEQVICEIAAGGLTPVRQDEACACYCGKICKDDGLACWEKSAEELANMVRAYLPWPSVRAYIPARNGSFKMIKITDVVALESREEQARPGEILSAGREGIVVACGSGALKIVRLIPEGKKEMGAVDYLRGNPLPGEHLFMGMPPGENRVQ